MCEFVICINTAVELATSEMSKILFNHCYVVLMVKEEGFIQKNNNKKRLTECELILSVFSGQQAEARAGSQCWSRAREVLLFFLARQELYSQ